MTRSTDVHGKHGAIGTILRDLANLAEGKKAA